MHILERLADFIAPDDCLSCGREGQLLCPACLPLLLLPPGYCYGCQKTLLGAACKDCLVAAGLDSLQAAAHYTTTAKALILQLKFRGNQSAARSMAELMRARCALPKDGLLVHVPATTAHVRERGYDQSQLLVRHLSRSTGFAEG